MNPKTQSRAEKGFTLIEIIAVLVILGILSSVAMPRFFDFQADARASAVEGALGAVASTLSQTFAQWLIDNPTRNANAFAIAAADQNVVLGDFNAILTGACGANASVVLITGGPGWWPADAGGFPADFFDAGEGARTTRNDGVQNGSKRFVEYHLAI